jgi:hypothetical protein
VSLATPPSATPQLLPPLGPVTEAVLFHGLPGAPSVPTDPRAWAQELHVLLREGLAGLALAALDGSPSDIDVDDRAQLTSAHRAGVAMSSVAQAWAPDAIRGLTDLGIDAVVVKGPGVAAFYPRSGLRPFEDVDVVVSPERFSAAMDVLEVDGFFRPVPPRGFFPLHCREGVNMGRADGASIDLHHRIPPWALTQRLTSARILHASVPLDLGRGVVRGASATHNLLIAALQIIGFRTASTTKLKAWRDMHELARHCDADETSGEVREMGLDWYLALVLRQMPSYARPIGLLESLGAAPPRRSQMARLRRIVPPSIGSRNFSVGRLYRLPPANGLAYLAAKIFPSRAFLRGAYGSPWAYARWWRGAHEHLMDSAGAPPEAGRSRSESRR